METLSNIIIATISVAILLVYTWKVLNWAWFRPKKLEKFLRQQGLCGNSYRLLHGDLKEFSKSIKEAQSKPIDNLSNDIAPRIIPYFIQTISKYDERSKELDIWPQFQKLTSDMISRTAFGSSYEEGRRIFELQKEQAEIIMKQFNSIYIPGSRFLPTKSNKKMKETEKEVQESIRRLIDNRLKAKEAGQEFGDDLLGTLLESNSNEIEEQGSKEFGLTIDEVIRECKLFYFAGQETTSVWLVWTMILLSRHQDWQAKAREEVLQAFGSDQPAFDELSRLKIVTMILYESLRLYPPLATRIRRTNEETRLGNLYLPNGSLIFIPTILLHHDKEIWGEDAEEFKPERFKEGVLKATKGQMIFFPFGAGPRICIGHNFAMLEAKMAVALILQRFVFELSPSYTHVPHCIVALQPKFGAPLLLQRL
uniref:CYP72A56 n=1 Tax=Solanum tuberosum TaxID=4113 RepID=M1BGH1_SOLTU